MSETEIKVLDFDTQLQDIDIYGRIAGISSELRYVQKGSTVKGKTKSGGEFSYKGVSHDAVVAQLQPYFAKYRIHAFPTVIEERYDVSKSMTVLKVEVMFACVDDVISPVVFKTHVYGYGQDYGDKGVGKAYSYAMKYALLKTFFLETGEDDEQRAEVDTDATISGYFVDYLVNQVDSLFVVVKGDRGQDQVQCEDESKLWRVLSIANGIQGDDFQLKQRVWRKLPSLIRSYISDMEKG